MRSTFLLRAATAAAFAVASCVVAFAKGDTATADPNVLVDIVGIGHCSGALINTSYGKAVLTAGHCAVPGAKFTMTDQFGNKTGVEPIYVDHFHDLAIMQVDGKPASIGSYDLRCNVPLAVGETVHMTGYPLDLGRLTVTGKVAAAPTTQGFWPDAATAVIEAGEGNSGSAVTDDAGKVVGVLVGGIGQIGNIAFVVPVTDLCNPGIAK